MSLSVAELTTVQTPNAVMRTYASPSVNDAPLAVWRTEMAPAAAGPVHEVSETQVLVVLEGEATVTLAGRTSRLAARDGLLLPAHEPRQIVAGPEGVVTLTSALPGATARVGDGEPVPVPWAR